MRNKLQKFTHFADQLLPHELAYLQQVHQLQDEANKAILARIRHNAERGATYHPYDTSIDKRKYSNLKKWINQKLQAIDVDRQYRWYCQMDEKMATDTLLPEEEAQLVQALRVHHSGTHFFVRFYELMQQYRHYLLLRVQQHDLQYVDVYLNREKQAYERALQAAHRLRELTQKLSNHHLSAQGDLRQWEPWLRETFMDDTLDGQNRYQALQQLGFVYARAQAYEKLMELYEQLERALSKGHFYSRRLLTTYYAQRLMLHARRGELDEAEYYGHLSLRHHDANYLQHLNSLAGVLLQRGKRAQALAYLKEAAPVMRKSRNYHNKAGFVAFYVKCLNEEGELKKARQYMEAFLRADGAHIFTQRWHVLFTIYFQTLLAQQEYADILKVIRRYKLRQRDEELQPQPNYLPTLPLYEATALYVEGRMNAAKFEQQVAEILKPYQTQPHKLRVIEDFLQEVHPHVPRLIGKFVPEATESRLSMPEIW